MCGGSAGSGAARSGGTQNQGKRARKVQPASPKRKSAARFQQLDMNSPREAGDSDRGLEICDDVVTFIDGAMHLFSHGG